MQPIKPRRHNRAKCSCRPLQREKCSYRPTLDCPRLTTRSHAMRLFPPIWTQNVVCTSSNMVAMWLVWIPPSLRSSGYTSHSSQSPPCRPWYTIYYCVQTGKKSRIAWLRVEQHAANCASATQSGEMFMPPDTWLSAANYALVRNETFSTNLDTKRRVYLERHGGDVTRVNTALATLERVHFTLVTIATTPSSVHNLLICASGALTCFYATVESSVMLCITIQMNTM